MKKKNNITTFTLLFIALFFLELFCIAQAYTPFYIPLVAGVALLGSTYLLANEIKKTILEYLEKKDTSESVLTSAEEKRDDENASEILKLSKASYVLQKRMLNLLEERIILPEENSDNFSSLEDEVIKSVKTSIKYGRDNARQLIDTINKSSNKNVTELKKEFADISSKLDAVSVEIKSSGLSSEAIRQQLILMTDILRHASLSGPQIIRSETSAISLNNDFQNGIQSAPKVTEENPVSEPENFVHESVIEAMPTSNIEITEEIPEEKITETLDSPAAEEIPVAVEEEINIDKTVTEEIGTPEIKTVTEEIAAEPEVLSKPVPIPMSQTSDDPNKAMSPEEIAALFASTAVESETLSEPVPAPMPQTSDDPNKAMSPEEIAALFASSGQ